MIAAIYGRTSKETDDNYSVSSQVHNGLSHAHQHSLTVPPEYIFREDFSGKYIDRPEYSKIRQLIMARKIQVLIIAATDRLARKASVAEILLDEMFENGVQLHIVSWNAAVRHTPEDRLRFQFEATFSGYERDKIVARTTEGKFRKAYEGNLVGNSRPPYGYDLNKYKTNFVPNEQAPIAREVLIAYGIKHLSALTIARSLQERNIPTPGVLFYEYRAASARKKFEAGLLTEAQFQQRMENIAYHKGQNRWTDATVHGILKHWRIYAGEYTFQLANQTFTVEVPPVISPEEAEEVQRMLAVGRSRQQRKNIQHYQALMARRLSCGLCKFSYNTSHDQRSHFYYRCSSQRTRNSVRCPNRPVRAVEIDALARTFVKELLLNPKRLFAW